MRELACAAIQTLGAARGGIDLVERELRRGASREGG